MSTTYSPRCEFVTQLLLHKFGSTGYIQKTDRQTESHPPRARNLHLGLYGKQKVVGGEERNRFFFFKDKGVGKNLGKSDYNTRGLEMHPIFSHNLQNNPLLRIHSQKES